MIPTWRFEPVRTKRQFTERYLAGEFGNRAPSWATVEEFVNAGRLTEPGPYHLRNRREAGGPGWYHLSGPELVGRWRGLESGGWYASLQVPPEVQRTLLLQGEVQPATPGTGGCGLELYGTTVPRPMREALQECSFGCQGLEARARLQGALDPNSYEWLLVLLERYPGHVVEFSAFRLSWGTVRGYNTLFWEVRCY